MSGRYRLGPGAFVGDRDSFRASGRTRIDGWLHPDDAAALAAELRASEDWCEVFNAGEKAFEISRKDQQSIDPEKRRQIDEALNLAARTDFQYRFETQRVPDEAAGRAAGTRLLDRFAEFMSSPLVLAYLRELTGFADVDFVDAQATSYRPGDFLTAHHDEVAGKSRRAAYVLGLTHGWRAEWGGLLMFHDDDGSGGDHWVPQFNRLHLFSVPRLHSVSQVTPFAGTERLSVTGWLRARGLG